MNKRKNKVRELLVKAVRANLDALFERRKRRRRRRVPDHLDYTAWTADVKQALCEACKSVDRDAWVGASGVESDDSEWLYDVACLKYDDEGYLRRTLLVAEVEWCRDGDIWYDFEKLLVAQADVRVMVFLGTYWPKSDPRFKYFGKYVKKLETAKPSDTYLIAERHLCRFEYRQFPEPS